VGLTAGLRRDKSLSLLRIEPRFFYQPSASFIVAVTTASIPAVVHGKVTLQRITDGCSKMVLTGCIWLKVIRSGRLM